MAMYKWMVKRETEYPTELNQRLKSEVHRAVNEFPISLTKARRGLGLGGCGAPSLTGDIAVVVAS